MGTAGESAAAAATAPHPPAGAPRRPPGPSPAAGRRSPPEAPSAAGSGRPGAPPAGPRRAMFQPAAAAAAAAAAAKRCFTIESLVAKDSHPLADEPLRPPAPLGYPAGAAAVEAFAHGFQGSAAAAAAAARSLYGGPPELLFPEAVSHPPLPVHPPPLAAAHLPHAPHPFFGPQPRGDPLHFYPWVLRNRFFGHRFQGKSARPRGGGAAEGGGGQAALRAGPGLRGRGGRGLEGAAERAGKAAGRGGRSRRGDRPLSRGWGGGPGAPSLAPARMRLRGDPRGLFAALPPLLGPSRARPPRSLARPAPPRRGFLAQKSAGRSALLRFARCVSLNLAHREAPRNLKRGMKETLR